MASRWLSDLIGTKLTQFWVRRAKLDSSGLTADRTFNLPDQGGTIALTSDISGGSVAGRTTVTVDFGAVGQGFVSLAVTGIAWASNAINYIVNPVAHADHSVEETIAEGVFAQVGNIVDGDGFTLFVTTPGISKGHYSFEIVGV